MSAGLVEVKAGELTGRHCSQHITIPGLGDDPPVSGLWLHSVEHDDRETILTVRIRGGKVRLLMGPGDAIGVGQGGAS